MIQLGANPNYRGFLVIGDRWSVAILLKHLLFLMMAGISAYLTWGLLPKMQRLALRRARAARDGVQAGKADTLISFDFVSLQRQDQLLFRLNLVMGILVLALTAVARTS